MRPFFVAAGWVSALVQRLCGGEHGVDVARYLYAAPLLAQHAFRVDEEGAAVDAQVFLAVELLQLDHVEQLTERFVLVGDKFEGEALLGLEVLVGLGSAPSC